jgi:two-component system OmpR family response regulator
VRVLVVEDEKSVATGVKRALTAEGYQVDVAQDGDTGLELATTGHYDLIVLDVMLPKRSGLDVCRELREQGDRIPIIMLTARSSQSDIIEGLDIGADDYLPKPFSMAVLLARVRARTRGSAGPGGVILHGDLRLDPSARRCWRGDTEIELTGREAAVLKVLFARDDEVLTKTELLRLVWGGEFNGDPNVVEVYVGRLRRKLDTPYGTDDIETVRGVGYRLRSTQTAEPGR